MCDLGISEEDAKKYTYGSNKKIEVVCPDCGNKKECRIKDIYRYKSIRCCCNSDGVSYPEKFMTNILNQINIKFKSEYSPKYLGRKSSDFYLPDYNLVIETDGKIGHYGGVTHRKSKKTLEECIEIDKWKDEQHKLHGIETIRIDCFKSEMNYIKDSILNSKLIKILDFSMVDWEKADLYAIRTNKVKEICEYWNNKEEWETTGTIAKNNKWGLKSKSAIREILKKGAKLGWCNYDPKEEMVKVVKNRKNKSSNNIGKQIEMFKDGQSLGIFESCHELDRQSVGLFGVKLDYRNISMVCNGKRKTYKGFTFKHV